MGLARRVIPTLLYNGDRLLKGERFNGWRTVGHIEQAARIYAHRAVDEVILLDITATPEGRGPDFKRIERISRDFFTPLTVGGGVRSVQDVRDLLSAGADKVAIGTVSAVMRSAAEKFGSQAIVASADYLGPLDGAVWRNQWFPKACEDEGAGEILLTAIDREGTMEGYDLDMIRGISASVSVPVIAHGGCASYEDMHLALEAGASAVAAGALFQFSDATPKEAALYLQRNGHEVRIP